MNQDSRRMLAACLLVAGIVTAQTSILAPIHEMFHVSSAQRAGCKATWEWAVTTMDCPATDNILMAGYWGELIFWSFAAIVPWVGVFAAGYVMSRYLYAFMSADFARLSPEYVDKFAMLGALAVALALTVAVLVNWGKIKPAH